MGEDPTQEDEEDGEDTEDDSLEDQDKPEEDPTPATSTDPEKDKEIYEKDLVGCFREKKEYTRSYLSL
jgi:hypothetical protein